MSIKALCAAAVVVAGMGQAEAATYKVTLTFDYQDYTCAEYEGPCDGPPPYQEAYDGVPFYKKVVGFLDLPETYGTISFDGGEYTAVFGQYSRSGNYYYNNQALWFVDYFYFDAESLSGGYLYADDGVPWNRSISASIGPAPVPLPASAALLPLGLGALALTRRRRKAH